MAWILPVRLHGEMLMAPGWLPRVFGHAAVSPVVPTHSGHLTSADMVVPPSVEWFLACAVEPGLASRAVSCGFPYWVEPGWDKQSFCWWQGCVE